MTREEAEDFIYSYYMEVLPRTRYSDADGMKRDPRLTEEIIRRRHSGGLSVAVTGSKGKGSVAYILSRILGTSIRCGLMVSPHISRFNERFSVSGEYITDTEFIDIVSEIKDDFERIWNRSDKKTAISPIGIQTVIAEEYFKRHGVLAQIYECGKGVRYDDVKNVPATYAVINSIFPEHKRELGPLLSDIAEDKADIIRPGVRACFSAGQDETVLSIIRERAAREGTALYVYGEDFEASDITYSGSGMKCDIRIGDDVVKGLEISLMGEHQCRNLALALALSKEILGLKLDQNMDRVREVLKELRWPGRLSVIRRSPLVMVDCCINRMSAKSALDTTEQLGARDAAFILAIPDDKDYTGVAREVSKRGYDIILTRAVNPHYRFEGIQQGELFRQGIKADYRDSLASALDDTKARPVIILGTTAILNEVKEIFGDI